MSRKVPRPATSPPDDLPGEGEGAEAGVLSPAGQVAAQHHDNLSTLREVVIGHRAAFIDAGFDRDVADEMAAALHETLLPEFVT